MKKTFQVPASIGLSMLVTLAACSGTEKEEYSFEIIERDGVITALTENGPKYSEDLFKYISKLTLKEEHDNPESLIDSPRWFVMAEDGTFFLPHSNDNRIQVFSPEGDYLRSFGREGDGPGEFRNPMFQSLIGDTIAVFDHQQQRTTVYRTDGTLLDIIRHPNPTGISDGLFEGLDGVLISIRQPHRFKGNILQMCGGVLTSTAGGDSINWNSTEWVDWGCQTGGAGSVGVFNIYPYAPEPLAIFDPITESYLLSSGNEPVISWFRLDGPLFRKYRFSIPRERIVKKAILSEAMDGLEKARESAARIERIRDNLKATELPRYKAFWRTIIHDSGYLWLEKPGLLIASIEKYESPVYRVISPEGEYLGDTEWPERQATVMNGRLLALVQDNETGSIVPTIFEISTRVEGLKFP